MQLTEDELAATWREYAGEGRADALDSLVRHYAPLARFLARRSSARAPAHQDPDDLLSSAMHGLLQAIERFDPERGIKFESFASRRIAGAIADGQRREDPLTRSARAQVSALRNAQQRLWERLARTPTLEELSAELGISVQEVRALAVEQQTLTKELTEAESISVASGEDDLHLRELGREALEELTLRLARLSDADRDFILRYYVEEKTLRSIGEILGCSDTRCAQIRNAMCLRILNQIADR